MPLLPKSDYGVTKKTLKLDCFLIKVWASRHMKCILPHIHIFRFKSVQKQTYDIL